MLIDVDGKGRVDSGITSDPLGGLVTEVPDNPDDSLGSSAPARRRLSWPRILGFGVIPLIAIALAFGTGFFAWTVVINRETDSARAQSMQTARESTIALLSYRADNVEQLLGSARDLLTGQFRDSYTSLINSVVIPGAKDKHISVTVTVPAVASVSADPHHAVALVFVDQSAVVGTDAPTATATASSVRVTMDKIGGRWLISGFDPV